MVTDIPKPDSEPDVEIRDADDVWVYASALAGPADVLVTGDRDLLDIAEHVPLRILSPRECWQWLRGQGSVPYVK